MYCEFYLSVNVFVVKRLDKEDGEECVSSPITRVSSQHLDD